MVGIIVCMEMVLMFFPLIDEAYFQYIFADYLEEQGDFLSEILKNPWFIGLPAIKQCIHVYSYCDHGDLLTYSLYGDGEIYSLYGGNV